MIENIQHEYFIWEEKNSTEQKTKLENNGVNEEVISTNEIKNDSTQKDWKDITDPKLRRKMRKKAYYLANKSKINARNKAWGDNNKEKRKITSKIWYESNKDTLKVKCKDYRDSNKEKISLYGKNYHQTNKEKRKLQKKLYYQINKEKRKLCGKLYYENNKSKRHNYHYNKLNTDIQYKLRNRLRSRLYNAINNNQKVGSAVKDLGCSIEEFKIYLESKFSPDMTWENWSINGWHIDHIKPISSFDLTDRKQLLEACHYTNLQPLWADENLTKGKKVEILEKKF
jgi:hypothetical protein